MSHVAPTVSREAVTDEFAWPHKLSRSLVARERQLILALGDALLWVALSAVLAYAHWGPANFKLVAPLSASAWLLVGYFGRMYRLGTVARIRSSFDALVKTAIGVDAVLLIAFFIQPEFV